MISIPVKSRIPPHMRYIKVVFPTQHNTTTIIMTKESYATAAAALKIVGNGKKN